MTDGLDPQASAVLATLKALAPVAAPDADDARWLADFRCQVALLRTFAGAVEPVHAIDHLIVAGPAGDLPVRLYRPAPGPLPLLFHVHGGGGIAGSVDGHDPLLRALANRTGWLVAAPDYRLAPEWRFPVQLEESYAALIAVAALLDIAAGRVVVSGDSIGGAIAAALAMLVRDRGGPALAGQALLYPNTDLRSDADYPSRRSEDGRIIVAADLERQIGLYVAQAADRDTPLASPIVGDLARLPPAFVATNDRDPLRDEGLAYAAALAAEGVSVTGVRMSGVIHACLQMRGAIDAADGLVDDLAAWLSRV